MNTEDDEIVSAGSGRTEQVDVYSDALISIIVERENFVKHSIRIITWLVVVLIVISGGNFIGSIITKNATDDIIQSADEIKVTTKEGRDASVDTLNELRAILARIRASGDEPDVQNQAIIDALQAIARIEAFVCAGPCPEP